MPWTKKVDGLRMPAFAEKHYHQIRDMPLRHGDVIVCTYPKCGTHWISYIIWRILHPDETNPQGNRVKEDIPYLEFHGPEVLDEFSKNSHRTIFTHYPADKLPNSPCAKYVVLVRNPFDCCASYFHFCKATKGLGVPESTEEGTGVSNVYLDDFLRGEVAYGCFFQYAKKWYDRKDEPNVHFVVYEQMKANPKEEILKLAAFLGYEDVLLDNDGKVLDQIIEGSSFENMKKNCSYSNPFDEGKDLPLFRKGKTGSYKDSLTQDQVLKLRRKMEAELEGTQLLDLWRHL